MGSFLAVVAYSAVFLLETNPYITFLFLFNPPIVFRRVQASLRGPLHVRHRNTARATHSTVLHTHSRALAVLRCQTHIGVRSTAVAHACLLEEHVTLMTWSKQIQRSALDSQAPMFVGSHVSRDVWRLRLNLCLEKHGDALLSSHR